MCPIYQWTLVWNLCSTKNRKRITKQFVQHLTYRINPQKKSILHVFSNFKQNLHDFSCILAKYGFWMHGHVDAWKRQQKLFFFISLVLIACCFWMRYDAWWIYWNLLFSSFVSTQHIDRKLLIFVHFITYGFWTWREDSFFFRVILFCSFRFVLLFNMQS